MKQINWQDVYQSLNEKGFALLRGILSKEECHAPVKSYPVAGIYRNVSSMRRYRFGIGEYKYFAYPLPSLVQRLREEFYPPLSTLANQWNQILSTGITYPSKLPEFLDICHHKNQQRPTPLILSYEKGGYNTLHQDLYGEIYFPFQVVFVLTQPGIDHEGGEFVLTEQVPRAQSRAHVINPNQGDAVIFTTNFRPVKGSKGYYRARIKHGIAEVKSGNRYALGVIFHDAA